MLLANLVLCAARLDNGIFPVATVRARDAEPGALLEVGSQHPETLHDTTPSWQCISCYVGLGISGLCFLYVCYAMFKLALGEPFVGMERLCEIFLLPREILYEIKVMELEQLERRLPQQLRLLFRKLLCDVFALKMSQRAVDAAQVAPDDPVEKNLRSKLEKIERRLPAAQYGSYGFVATPGRFAAIEATKNEDQKLHLEFREALCTTFGLSLSKGGDERADAAAGEGDLSKAVEQEWLAAMAMSRVGPDDQPAVLRALGQLGVRALSDMALVKEEDLIAKQVPPVVARKLLSSEHKPLPAQVRASLLPRLLVLALACGATIGALIPLLPTHDHTQLVSAQLQELNKLSCSESDLEHVFTVLKELKEQDVQRAACDALSKCHAELHIGILKEAKKEGIELLTAAMRLNHPTCFEAMAHMTANCIHFKHQHKDCQQVIVDANTLSVAAKGMDNGMENVVAKQQLTRHGCQVMNIIARQLPGEIQETMIVQIVLGIKNFAAVDHVPDNCLDVIRHLVDVKEQFGRTKPGHPPRLRRKNLLLSHQALEAVVGILSSHAGSSPTDREVKQKACQVMNGLVDSATDLNVIGRTDLVKTVLNAMQDNFVETQAWLGCLELLERLGAELQPDLLQHDALGVLNKRFALLGMDTDGLAKEPAKMKKCRKQIAHLEANDAAKCDSADCELDERRLCYSVYNTICRVVHLVAPRDFARSNPLYKSCAKTCFARPKATDFQESQCLRSSAADCRGPEATKEKECEQVLDDYQEYFDMGNYRDADMMTCCKEVQITPMPEPPPPPHEARHIDNFHAAERAGVGRGYWPPVSRTPMEVADSAMLARGFRHFAQHRRDTAEQPGPSSETARTRSRPPDQSPGAHSPGASDELRSSVRSSSFAVDSGGGRASAGHERRSNSAPQAPEPQMDFADAVAALRLANAGRGELEPSGFEGKSLATSSAAIDGGDGGDSDSVGSQLSPESAESDREPTAEEIAARFRALGINPN